PPHVSDERPDPILNMLQAIRVEQSAQREKLDEIIVRPGKKRMAEKRRAWERIPAVRDAGECTLPGMTTTNRTYKSGQSRDQASFLPPCLEDYVGRDNAVRAIDAYADSLDLSGLGFGDVGSDGGTGQPPYDPAYLLKLYLYGYLHQVRSSRRLEREARRNVELMWLLRGLAPGYRTIANFRK